MLHILQGVLDLFSGKRPHQPVGLLMLFLRSARAPHSVGKVVIEHLRESPVHSQLLRGDPEVIDLLQGDLMVLSNQSGIAGAIEHDLFQRFIFQKPLQFGDRDLKGINQVEGRLIKDLDEAEVLAVDMKVVLPFEIHRDRGDVVFLPCVSQLGKGFIAVDYRILMHRSRVAEKPAKAYQGADRLPDGLNSFDCSSL